MNDVTVLLQQADANDSTALDRLFEALYSDLRRMASARLAENGPQTLLDTTSLAHEAYLRLRSAGRVDVESRWRFMAYASQVLRSVIVDFARRRNAERRGGGRVHLTLNEELAESLSDDSRDVERLNDALLELDKSDPRLRQIVELIFFGGLTHAEVAEALGIGERTVRRDWERARLLLSVSLDN